LHPPAIVELTAGHSVEFDVPVGTIVVWLAGLHSVDVLRVVTHGSALSDETDSSGKLDIDIVEQSCLHVGDGFIEL
jgi:hypothetical protein